MVKRRVPSPDPAATRPGTAAPVAGQPTAPRAGDPRRTGDHERAEDQGRSRDQGQARDHERVGDQRRVEGVGSVVVRVRPGAGRTRVGGRYEGPHGPALIVAVGAPAVDGKATEAVRRALAAALGVKAREVVLKVGATSRDKVFTVVGDVGERLAALRDGST